MRGPQTGKEAMSAVTSIPGAQTLPADVGRCVPPGEGQSGQDRRAETTRDIRSWSYPGLQPSSCRRLRGWRLARRGCRGRLGDASFLGSRCTNTKARRPRRNATVAPGTSCRQRLRPGSRVIESARKALARAEPRTVRRTVRRTVPTAVCAKPGALRPQQRPDSHLCVVSRPMCYFYWPSGRGGTYRSSTDSIPSRAGLHMSHVAARGVLGISPATHPQRGLGNSAVVVPERPSGGWLKKFADSQSYRCSRPPFGLQWA